MKKKKSKKLKLLLILLLVISVGYAIVSTILKINGDVLFARQSWDVYWTNPQVIEGSKTMVKPSIVDDGANSRNAKATWEVSFELPGEYYEFTIDAVNAGTLDAVITGIDTTIAPNAPEYISYTLTYVDGTPVKENHVLKKATGGVSTVARYKVRIEYLVDKVDAQFINDMEGNISYTCNFGITYSRSTAPAMNDRVLSEEELETFVAQVQTYPELYRNPDQDPANRDIGIDMYGNVINLDKFTSTPSLQYGRCKSYNMVDDYAYIGGGCSAQYYALTWATASENFSNGEWLLTYPAYIMFDEDEEMPGEFRRVANIQSFFNNHHVENGQEDNYLEKFAPLPYTITSIGDEAFQCDYTLDGPITIPRTVTTISPNAFLYAFKSNTPNKLILPSHFNDEYYSDPHASFNVDEVEFYD